MPEYRALEITFERVIAERFNLPYPEPPEIKRVDNQMIASEAVAFFGPERRRAFNLPEPPADVVIEPWSSERAEKEFLTLFMALVEGE